MCQIDTHPLSASLYPVGSAGLLAAALRHCCAPEARWDSLSPNADRSSGSMRPLHSTKNSSTKNIDHSHECCSRSRSRSRSREPVDLFRSVVRPCPNGLNVVIIKKRNYKSHHNQSIPMPCRHSRTSPFCTSGTSLPHLCTVLQNYYALADTTCTNRHTHTYTHK